MPYIRVAANVPLEPVKCETLKAKIGQSVQLLNKTEDWLMVEFCENGKLFYAGSSEPAAMVSVDLYGAAGKEAYADFTKEVCGVLEQELGISPKRTFVKYSEYENWGWNNRNL